MESRRRAFGVGLRLGLGGMFLLGWTCEQGAMTSQSQSQSELVVGATECSASCTARAEAYCDVEAEAKCQVDVAATCHAKATAYCRVDVTARCDAFAREQVTERCGQSAPACDALRQSSSSSSTNADEANQSSAVSVSDAAATQAAASSAVVDASSAVVDATSAVDKGALSSGRAAQGAMKSQGSRRATSEVAVTEGARSDSPAEGAGGAANVTGESKDALRSEETLPLETEGDSQPKEAGLQGGDIQAADIDPCKRDEAKSLDKGAPSGADETEGAAEEKDPCPQPVPYNYAEASDSENITCYEGILECQLDAYASALAECTAHAEEGCISEEFAVCNKTAEAECHAHPKARCVQEARGTCVAKCPEVPVAPI